MFVKLNSEIDDEPKKLAFIESVRNGNMLMFNILNSDSAIDEDDRQSAIDCATENGRLEFHDILKKRIRTEKIFKVARFIVAEFCGVSVVFFIIELLFRFIME